MLEGEDLLHHDAAARERYDPLFSLGARLLRFGLVMLPAGSIEYGGPSPKIVAAAVLALFATATKTFRAIHHLGGNALAEPGVMLLRPLDEAWASLGYIIAEPKRRAERAEWYLAGEATEKYKWAQKLRGAGLTTLLPPESLRDPEAILDSIRRRLVTREAVERGEPGAEERAAQRLKEMLATGRWADVGNEAMHGIAERWASGGVVEELVTYVTVFKMGSGVPACPAARHVYEARPGRDDVPEPSGRSDIPALCPVHREPPVRLDPEHGQ